MQRVHRSYLCSPNLCGGHQLLLRSMCRSGSQEQLWTRRLPPFTMHAQLRRAPATPAQRSKHSGMRLLFTTLFRDRSRTAAPARRPRSLRRVCSRYTSCFARCNRAARLYSVSRIRITRGRSFRVTVFLMSLCHTLAAVFQLPLSLSRGIFSFESRPNHAMEPTPPDLFMSLFAVQLFTCSPPRSRRRGSSWSR